MNVKTDTAPMPSDFVRTEYLQYGTGFTSKMRHYLGGLVERCDYYATVAETVKGNPLLAIDYYRRAFLISGDARFKVAAQRIFEGEYLRPVLTSIKIPDLIDFNWMR